MKRAGAGERGARFIRFVSFLFLTRSPLPPNTENKKNSTLWSKGLCVEQGMEQLYSEAAGKFLADRFVTGTCPRCGYS